MSQESDVKAWWTTGIINMRPGVIEIRNHPIQELIESKTFTEMIWLMALGTQPSKSQSRLLEAALVAAVDHGPQAPSIAASRMAITCGVGINNAIATGVNMLGDVHGGAGEQAVELFVSVAARMKSETLDDAILNELDYRAELGQKYLPGFGHRFHKPEDPRARPLLSILRQCSLENQSIEGQYATIAERMQHTLHERSGIAIALNIDGATGAIFAALGISPMLARGLFCLSRSVGLMAHSYEQAQQGERNKGPTPPHYLWKYDPT